MLRCFRFSYSMGPGVVRWLDDRGAEWAQQVMVVRQDGRFEYTALDEDALFYMPGVLRLLRSGDAEELT